jgi:anti-sigma regulatory factor (Ser/Thr protein kinase)
MGSTLLAWTMPADAASISAARHRVVDLLRGNGWDEQRTGEAALMTTELATNAVVHVGAPFTLTIDVGVRGLRVDVRDPGAELPIVNLRPAPRELSGRGLALVAAFADRWGYEPADNGKSVWFETSSLRSAPVT